METEQKTQPTQQPQQQEYKQGTYPPSNFNAPQQQQQVPNYAQTQYRSPNNLNSYTFKSDDVMSVGDYVITMLIMALPLVGFIMTLVWAFGSSVNANKKNFCRATLIWMIIGIAISVIMIIVLVATGAFAYNRAYTQYSYTY